MPSSTNDRQWFYILFPAVAMCLGWGLRGYIGGGPFGAMMPGAFVALCISLMLGHAPAKAAIVAMFGAIAVGYGGEMTYGQTLGLARDPEAMWWGLLGVTVKGSVWGLLGGAVLGAGLVHNRYQYKDLLIAFLITIVSFYIGWKLINQPKLIYFSDPVNKPRGESWAGLLFSAIGFLTYLSWKYKNQAENIPLRFALWGALGGGIGFGGGVLWLVNGPNIPIPQKWIGWWKMMEFTFGLVFGAALGYAAYRNRESLATNTNPETEPRQGYPWLAGLVALVLVFFLGLPALIGTLRSANLPEESLVYTLVADPIRMLYSFTFLGAVAIILGLRSIATAWHVAITLTFFHTIYDLMEDVESVNGFSPSVIMQVAIVLGSTLLIALAAEYLQRQNNPVPKLYLLVMWACYLIACMKSFVVKDYFAPETTFWQAMINHHPATPFVHTTFTITILITTFFIITRFMRDSRV